MARRSSAAPTAVAPQSSHRYRFHHVLRGARYVEGIERQGELAALLDVSKFRVWEWETARVRPSQDELRRLCGALPVLRLLLEHARPEREIETVQL